MREFQEFSLEELQLALGECVPAISTMLDKTFGEQLLIFSHMLTDEAMVERQAMILYMLKVFTCSVKHIAKGNIPDNNHNYDDEYDEVFVNSPRYNDTQILADIHNSWANTLPVLCQPKALSRREIGLLNLPTGRIVAADPMKRYPDYMEEKIPFERTVNPGKYPVVLYGVNMGGQGQNAFAEIRFTSNPPVAFEHAIMNRDSNRNYRQGSPFGFAVTDLQACFMDYAAAESIKSALEISERDILLDMMTTAADNADEHFFMHAVYDIPGTDHNIALFGVSRWLNYPCFWGKDLNGDICCLITSFLLNSDDPFTYNKQSHIPHGGWKL